MAANRERVIATNFCRLWRCLSGASDKASCIDVAASKATTLGNKIIACTTEPKTLGEIMSNTPKADTLPEVLDKTKEAKEQLESDSRELFVVNEVLKQEIPDPVKATADVAAALERSESIQNNMDAVAEDLDEVHKALADEVTRRKSAEKKLTETKADLADTKAQLADATDH